MIFDVALDAIADGADLTTEVKMALLMTSNNCAATRGAANLAALTLDEHDAAGYARQNMYLRRTAHSGSHSQRLTSRDSGNTADAPTLIFADLLAGTRSVAGVLICTSASHPTHPSLPLFYEEFTSPVASNGSDFEVSIHHAAIGGTAPNSIVADMLDAALI